jgi:Domain of unknown function (DUF4351)
VQLRELGAALLDFQSIDDLDTWFSVLQPQAEES